MATIGGFADLITLHRKAAHRFVKVVNAAVAHAKPLIEVAPLSPMNGARQAPASLVEFPFQKSFARPGEVFHHFPGGPF